MPSIVIVTSITVAATASAVSGRFATFGKVGAIIGSSVSAAFLIVLGVMNMYILYKLVLQMQKLLASGPGEEEEGLQMQGAGCLFRLFKKMFKLIDRYDCPRTGPLQAPPQPSHIAILKLWPKWSTRPWKMYPLGILFGLGFDTSSEVALLGIASIQAAKGTNIWLILIFPVLFTGESPLLSFPATLSLSRSPLPSSTGPPPTNSP